MSLRQLAWLSNPTNSVNATCAFGRVFLTRGRLTAMAELPAADIRRVQIGQACRNGPSVVERRRSRMKSVVVCVPGVPERSHIGALPANVELVLVARELSPGLDLTRVEFLVPADWAKQLVLARLGVMARLRVIQTLSAGVDWLRGRVPENVLVCNARGVYDDPMAEWVLGAILAMQRGLIQARDAQRAGEWHWFEPYELSGARIVILGFGSIGSAVAARLRPFGVDVVGVARTRREGVLGLEDLDGALRTADILIDLLPLSAETAGLLDVRRLGLLPSGALLVNAGRGPTVDTAALVDAVRSGRLRAVLDVTDPEPPPPNHPLWRLPGVLISPHLAGDSGRTLGCAFALAGDQIRRFAAGHPLENQVPPHLLT